MGWEENVVGGIGDPRLYRLDPDNLLSNGSFEEAIGAEWFGAGYSRVLASANAFTAPRGDYVLKVEDDSGAAWERAARSVDYGSALGNKSFLVYVVVRGATDHDIDIKLGSSTTSGGSINAASTLTVPVFSDYCRIIHLIKTFSSATDQFVRVELGGSGSTVSETGTAYFDDLRIYEILETYNLDQPNEWKHNWEQIKAAEYELADRTEKKIVQGWRYSLGLTYTAATAEDVQNFIELTESGKVFVVPHIDNLFGSFMVWDGSFEPQYFMGKYLGHTITLPLTSTEIVREKPREIATDYTIV